jgi:hypothetical protein
MTLPNGLYRTKAGSTVEISGTHAGISRVYFDWLEEPNACIECEVNPYPELWDEGKYHLTWSCEEGCGGNAELFPDSTVQETP